ncbi:MAG: NAD(P)-binding domain-containing protein [Rhodospirillaceae bacterium]|nr:NAD(P)-binding domain-containing protein [Rhodospirillaceae bacterium]
MKTPLQTNTVAVIGAGPVGIAAAAQLQARGLTPLVLEQGAGAGHAMREWGHVRVFTPWRYVTDDAVVRLLEKTGWTHPDGEHLPTGREIVEEYLLPAAATPELRDRITYGATVVAVSKAGLGKSSSAGRDAAPFTVHYRTAEGTHHVVEAGAVIDASGTWTRPNPIGADGLPVPGEADHADRIAYGIPDAFGTDRALYEGKRTLVLGGGHSAINAALDILHLKDSHPDTKLYWGLRRNTLEKLLGGGLNDQLPARGALGLAAKQAIDEGGLELLAPMRVRAIRDAGNALQVEMTVDGQDQIVAVDRIVVAAGFRPDLDMLRELRLDLDAVVEAPTALAPLIDPNLHSCGTVPPHGVEELSHPDRNFFVVGMKAYGRAPTFLMMTGYEQVRSIADELAGKHEAARRIELTLPETGVCNSQAGAPDPLSAGGACCGPDADEDAGPCCGPEAEAIGRDPCCEPLLAADARCCG